jgi:ABC-type sugar transport system ATPase subunit
VLDVRNLNVAYGQSEVLHGVNFTVTPGEIVAVVGRNGMGKSTLMKALIGVMPSRSGQVLVDGADLAGLPSHTRVKRGLSYVPQGRQIFGTMTVRENIETGRVVTGKSDIPGEICRADSNSSSQLRARSRAIRRSCCSTNRPREFSRRSSRTLRGCSRKSGNCAIFALWSASRFSASSSTWPIASWSSRMAASSTATPATGWTRRPSRNSWRCDADKAP